LPPPIEERFRLRRAAILDEIHALPTTNLESCRAQLATLPHVVVP
jgi:hypothetical protein